MKGQGNKQSIHRVNLTPIQSEEQIIIYKTTAKLTNLPLISDSNQRKNKLASNRKKFRLIAVLPMDKIILVILENL